MRPLAWLAGVAALVQSSGALDAEPIYCSRWQGITTCQGATLRPTVGRPSEQPVFSSGHLHVATRRARADYKGYGFSCGWTTSRHVLIAAARSTRCD